MAIHRNGSLAIVYIIWAQSFKQAQNLIRYHEYKIET